MFVRDTFTTCTMYKMCLVLRGKIHWMESIEHLWTLNRNGHSTSSGWNSDGRGNATGPSINTASATTDSVHSFEAWTNEEISTSSDASKYFSTWIIISPNKIFDTKEYSLYFHKKTICFHLICSGVIPSIRTPYIPRMARPILSQDRGAVEKMIDYIVGEGPNNRYTTVVPQCESVWITANSL